MKINCDYCGAQIDTDKYDTCPNCGGAFSRDREVIKEKEKLNKADELFFETKQLENERLRIENEKLRQNTGGGRTAVPSGCLVGLVTLAVIGVLFIILMIYIIADEESSEKNGSGTKHSISVSTKYSISMEPINIPDIPDIPDIPVIDIEPDIPEMTGLPEIPVNIPEITTAE